MGNDEGGGFAPLKKVISIHVPSWGTTGDFARTSGSWAFQSTFPRGERLARLGKFGWTALFQSTFPRGERLPCCRRIASSCYFNPRSLVGNDLSPSKIFPLFNHFNPRSLVGNDVYRNPKDLIPSISIHVPSWGTTGQGLYYHSQIQISIHVPSWGTTGIHVKGRTGPAEFQSTFPRGERHSLPLSPVLLLSISIHVPSWGTTMRDIKDLCARIISIHVPSWGTTLDRV